MKSYIVHSPKQTKLWCRHHDVIDGVVFFLAGQQFTDIQRVTPICTASGKLLHILSLCTFLLLYPVTDTFLHPFGDDAMTMQAFLWQEDMTDEGVAFTKQDVKHQSQGSPRLLCQSQALYVLCSTFIDTVTKSSMAIKKMTDAG